MEDYYYSGDSQDDSQDGGGSSFTYDSVFQFFANMTDGNVNDFDSSHLVAAEDVPVSAVLSSLVFNSIAFLLLMAAYECLRRLLPTVYSSRKRLDRIHAATTDDSNSNFSSAHDRDQYHPPHVPPTDEIDVEEVVDDERAAADVAAARFGERGGGGGDARCSNRGDDDDGDNDNNNNTNNSQSRYRAFPMEAFKAAFDDASKKLKTVLETEDEFNQVVDASLAKIEGKAVKNNKVQTYGSGAQVGAAVATLATGGAALIGVAAIGVVKWGSKARYKTKIMKHQNNAYDIMTKHHEARAEFIEAALIALKARDDLCKECPDFKRLRMNAIALAVTYPGVLPQLLSNTVYHTTLYMAEEHPETTLNVAYAILSGAVDVGEAVGLTAEAAVDAVGISIDAIPIIGLAINLEKLRRARKAQSNGTEEADVLREMYEKSVAHFQSMHDLIKEFVSKHLPRV